MPSKNFINNNDNSYRVISNEVPTTLEMLSTNTTTTVQPPKANYSNEDIIKENSRVGSLFASKAFVQLVANPVIGYVTSKHGYHLPFICGTAILLLSSISK